MIDTNEKENINKQLTGTVYSEMIQDLEKAIRNGIYVPGKPLPSEKVLSQQYGICRTSVRLGLRYLEEAGIVMKQPGKGTFIRLDDESTVMTEPMYTIAINIKNVTATYNEWYDAKIMRALLPLCNMANMRLSIAASDQLMLGRQRIADGLILSYYDGTAQELQKYFANGMEVVLFNRVSTDERIPYVAVNYRYESEDAVRYLQKKGHKHIATIACYGTTGTMRKTGYLSAMGFADFDPDMTCFVHTNREPDYYVHAIDQFLREKRKNFSALFVPSGSYAIAVFLACIRNGIRVPDDLELMFFDDIAYMYPSYGIPFHYIKMPLADMCRDALQYLQLKFRNPHTPVLKRLYGVEILQEGGTHF